MRNIIKRILSEKVINLFQKNDMYDYIDEIEALLDISYANIGGYSLSDMEKLIEKSYLWKMVRRNGEITAIKIYKDQFGRKSVAAATNGTPQGKKDLYMIMQDDIDLERSWGETSGAMSHIGKKLGSKRIKNTNVEKLINKEVIDKNKDGYRYTRTIGGKKHEKEILGFPKGIDIDE